MYSIYLVTNKVNGKIYIGYTKRTPDWRFSIHVKGARNRLDKNHHFANAIRKYGAESFIVTTIDIAETEVEAKGLETKHILARRSHDDKIGYNMTTGGEGGITDEVRRKLSIALKGKVRTAEMRKRISEAKRGKKTGPRSESHKANMSAILTGRFMGPESSTWKDVPVETVADLYRNGSSIRAIGARYSVSPDVISDRLASVGVQMRVRWNKCVDNMEKMRLRGEDCPWAKLTEVEVKQIRDLCLAQVMPQHQIGKAYGVSQGLVTKIHTGKSWTTR